LAIIHEASKLLELLRKGYSIEEAALTLNISEARARLLLSYLASKGLVRTPLIPCSLKCSRCPFRGRCSLSGGFTLYEIHGQGDNGRRQA